MKQLARKIAITMPLLILVPTVFWYLVGIVSATIKELPLTCSAAAKPRISRHPLRTYKLSIKIHGIVTIVITMFANKRVPRRPSFSVNGFEKTEPRVRPSTQMEDSSVLFQSTRSSFQSS